MKGMKNGTDVEGAESEIVGPGFIVRCRQKAKEMQEEMDHGR